MENFFPFGLVNNTDLTLELAPIIPSAGMAAAAESTGKEEVNDWICSDIAGMCPKTAAAVTATANIGKTTLRFIGAKGLVACLSVVRAREPAVGLWDKDGFISLSGRRLPAP